MVLAGALLDRVQHWPVFSAAPALFTMTPALLGLKGNLEMTLASRLSTLANVANKDAVACVRESAGANLALIQVQAVVVGALAALAPIAAAYALGQQAIDGRIALLLLASSILTASAAGLILGAIMLVVVTLACKYGVNPDNVATPIAAALGDLVTLALLASTSSTMLVPVVQQGDFRVTTAVLALLTSVPFAWKMAGKHSNTKEVLKVGWGPVLGAMIISSLGGRILERAIRKYPAMAAYQPVINGVAGNLVREPVTTFQGNASCNTGFRSS